MTTRRNFLQSCGVLGLSACARGGRDRDYTVPGRIAGGWSDRGHLLREPYTTASEPQQTIRCDTVIVGGGVSGLAAADALQRAGRHDFIICELGDEAGGNAISGAAAASRYPWGAHYVPIIDPDDEPLRDFFARAGIIRELRADGMPVYEETMLCSDPDERLWIHGLWQEGFVPNVGVATHDLAEAQRFLASVEVLRTAIGEDGKPAFALPLERSSADPRFRDLDAMIFTDYLERQGYTSPPLRWYLDYCCRDDFGVFAGRISAWAGLHYFAARRGRAANASHSDVVTWPEGNGFLVRALTAGLGTRLKRAVLARRVTVAGGRALVDAVDRNGQTLRIEADAALLAVPNHVLRHLVDDTAAIGRAVAHTPWVVANVTLSIRPGGDGAPLSWDNVVYRSRMLGYVVADHQSLGPPGDAMIITYYWPLNHLPEAEARRWAQRRAHADWCADFLGELYLIHPEVRGHVENLDVWIWGHGMSAPEPGYCWGPDRSARLAARPPLYFCHTDQSGMSIFEEAFSLGNRAASLRLKQVG